MRPAAFPIDHFVLRIGVVVADGFVEIDLDPIPAQAHGMINVGGDLPADDGVNIAHQARRLAQFAVANGLRDDQKNIMNLVVEVVRSKLPK